MSMDFDFKFVALCLIAIGLALVGRQLEVTNLLLARVVVHMEAQNTHNR